jgi:hypothetical protein
LGQELVQLDREGGSTQSRGPVRLSRRAARRSRRRAGRAAVVRLERRPEQLRGLPRIAVHADVHTAVRAQLNSSR